MATSQTDNDKPIYEKIGQISIGFSLDNVGFDTKTGERKQYDGQVTIYRGEQKFRMSYKEYMLLTKVPVKSIKAAERINKMLSVERSKEKEEDLSVDIPESSGVEKPVIEVSNVPKEYRKKASE